jgi:hypothetical protein
MGQAIRSARVGVVKKSRFWGAAYQYATAE